MEVFNTIGPLPTLMLDAAGGSSKPVPLVRRIAANGVIAD
jgi:hypothetical protein